MEGWSEESSRIYREVASVAVPRRAELIATLLCLAPFPRASRSSVVELACGEGLLAAAFLEAYPGVTVLALDGSPAMRTATAQRTERFGPRIEVDAFDLADAGWHHRLDDADLVVSSLALHHLDDDGKRDLYGTVAGRIAPRGGLLIADLVAPGSDAVRAFFAGQYDAQVKATSRDIAGDLSLWERFDGEDWNHFRTPDLDFDKPSVLAAQLRWLADAGFLADCFWMFAGHAVYGGYLGEPPPSGLAYNEALQIAERVLND